MILSVFSPKKIAKKCDLRPQTFFVVSKTHQSSFLILQKHAGSKIGDKNSKNK
jgi:hypothetical protein